MRFLFFQTFKFPGAAVTARLSAADLADLARVRRKTLPLAFALDLHGVTRDLTAEVVVTLLETDRVAVSSAAPTSIAAVDFGLDGGVAELQEAAGVTIIPSATVTFDFVLLRDGAAAAAPVALDKPAAAAMEAEGDFGPAACAGRFEILSRAGNITFASGSTRLTGAARRFWTASSTSSPAVPAGDRDCRTCRRRRLRGRQPCPVRGAGACGGGLLCGAGDGGGQVPSGRPRRIPAGCGQ